MRTHSLHIFQGEHECRSCWRVMVAVEVVDYVEVVPLLDRSWY